MNNLQEGNEPQGIGRRARRVYRGSIFWPLILVALGVIFLLRNIGALSGDAWDNLLKLWPVLLIAIGLDSLYRREGVAGAVFWIGLGVVFLLTNLGVFAWNAWDVILNLWPILLIAIGLDILVGRRSTWGAILAMAVLILVLVVALWFLGSGALTGQGPIGEEISQPLEGASQAHVVLKPAVGSVNVDALPESSQRLVQGQFLERAGETIRQDYSVQQGKATFSLRSEGISTYYQSRRGRSWDWRLSFNPTIAIDMEVGLGAGELVLDLSGLQISALDVDLGVGQTKVILPPKGRFRAEISGAIGEIIIDVPQGSQVRIESSTGLAWIEAPSSFQKEGDQYVTPDFTSSGDYIDLIVSQAIGKITVRISP